ncbi:MAG: hypothetical protein QNJ38_10895 [Prochloraceae cyanobacterium]|nr:hypothetical protein [Prochloraceae cyanobacterium]
MNERFLKLNQIKAEVWSIEAACLAFEVRVTAEVLVNDDEVFS